MEDNSNGRQINKDLQEITHLANAMKSLANVVGIRVDDIIIREAARQRREDENAKKE